MKAIEMFKSFWTARNTREQRVLAIGGIFLGILLLYSGIFQPIREKLTTLSEKLSTQKQTLAWMQSTLPTLKTLRQGNTHRQKIPGNSLLSFLESTLKQSPFSKTVKQLEKTPDESRESVTLQFDQVNFDEFIKWLIQLSNRYALNITQFSATRTKENGIVDVNIVIATQSTVEN